MFEGLLDTVINDTLIVSFAEQLDDEEFDPDCVSRQVVIEFKRSENPIPQGIYGAICYMFTKDITLEKNQVMFAMHHSKK